MNAKSFTNVRHANNKPPDVKQHILDVAKPLMLAKGFTAVGISEVLAAAAVPKGSFYHYFGSKEAFGEALLETYFNKYLEDMDTLFALPGTAAQRLMSYWQHWRDAHCSGDPNAGCLAVKLGAEVCDLSESMRAVLERGIFSTIERISCCIAAGKLDHSLPVALDARITATTLYQAWLGASLLAKITCSCAPFDVAVASTQQWLNISFQE